MKPVLRWVLKQPTRKNSYVLTEKLERPIERENEIKSLSLVVLLRLRARGRISTRGEAFEHLEPAG
jgi:hypothetical protein